MVLQPQGMQGRLKTALDGLIGVMLAPVTAMPGLQGRAGIRGRVTAGAPLMGDLAAVKTAQDAANGATSRALSIGAEGAK